MAGANLGIFLHPAPFGWVGIGIYKPCLLNSFWLKMALPPLSFFSSIANPDITYIRLISLFLSKSASESMVNASIKDAVLYSKMINSQKILY